jgi:uncharacterized membrane protein (DUF2068 family)
VDWSLLACGRCGHVTYAPAEADVRKQLSARTESGEAWRCLRCGAFVYEEPQLSGPSAQAPAVRRGKEIRSAFILRIFAIERFVRALAAGALAFVVWRIGYSRQSVKKAFDRELPALRTLFHQVGYDIDHSKLVGLIHHALTLSPTTIRLVAAGLAGFAVIELIEGVGLWLAQRWGEYFAMVATSLGLPYEIYELSSKITVTRSLLFVVNLALVLYLVMTKRLFGVRGGKHAYEARLRSESIMEAAIEAAAAGRDEAAEARRDEPAGPRRDEPEPGLGAPAGPRRDTRAEPGQHAAAEPGQHAAAEPGQHAAAEAGQYTAAEADRGRATAEAATDPGHTIVADTDPARTAL